MAKYNPGAGRITGTSPLRAERAPSGRTHEGGTGFGRDPRSELFLRATASFAGEDSFYENAATRDARLAGLTAQLAVTPDGFGWLAGFLPWLRSEASMRSAPVLLAAEAARARLAAGQAGGSRQLIADVLVRADEPGEMLGYWLARHGRAIPKPVKRGVADAARRLYTQRAFLRHDSAGRGLRFGDVLELCHATPDPAITWQGDLFGWVITARHNRDGAQAPASLRTVRARTMLNGYTPRARHTLARTALAIPGGADAEVLRRAVAGQWEWLLSWLGETPDVKAMPKVDQWRLILPDLGYMALIRNLRNLDEAGLDDETAAGLAARIGDPAEVARSRQLPFRFLSAHLNAPSQRWGHALELALDACLPNIPDLPGRTLILIDTSGSMGMPMSGKSQMAMVQAAALFGLALALKDPARADVWGFADGQFHVDGMRRGLSVLKATEAFCREIGRAGHGTRIAEAVRQTYRHHDRVVIFTDMQTFPTAGRGAYGDGHAGDVAASVPPQVPVYGFNLAGYTHSGLAGEPNRHELGGLTDATFRLIPLIEAAQAGRWPWQQPSQAAV